jgi:protein-disulfide isomerase
LLARLSGILDSLASVAVVIAVIVLVAGFVWPRQAPMPKTAQGADLAVPKEPLSLEGAALIGTRSARASLLVFSDFECPYCRKFGLEILPTIEKRYVDTGQLAVAYRQLPLKMHRYAEAAAMAAVCAAAQDKFRTLHDVFFTNQKSLDPEDLLGHVRSVGIELTAYEACLASTAPDRVKSDVDQAVTLGIRGTPAFFIGTLTPDQRIKVSATMVGARPLDEFVRAIDAALK